MLAFFFFINSNHVLFLAYMLIRKTLVKCKHICTVFCFASRHEKCDKHGFPSTFIASTFPAEDGTLRDFKIRKYTNRKALRAPISERVKESVQKDS